ncbi:MAG: Fic family protein [candidate division Zixibacteria bacterium]|nr:Fic family protein [candidate division Zixibacteria bacterium]
MDLDRFKKSQAGKPIKTEKGYWAFVPNPLPPAIAYTKELVALLSEADRQLGNLSGVGALLPNPDLLITPYIKREAVLSSKIEGTQTSLSDLFYFEAANKEEKRRETERTDVLEVVNYVSAINDGIKRLKELPLCLRLIREIHKELMRGVRGEHLTPGEFRRSQNWIGAPGCTLNEAEFIPPPVQEMNEALKDFEKFLHDRENFPGLIQCALIHYQFEAIHPFLDGNGRIGRLLITLFLCERKYLVYPLLYLSSFFEKYRSEYYDRLMAVSEKGEWEEWIKFFLRGVAVQSKDAVENSRSILNLLEKYRKLIQQQRTSIYVLKLLEEIFLNPFVTVPYAAKKLETTYPTAKSAIQRLKEAKILFEVTDKRWGKVFCAKELLELFEEKK